MDTTVASHVGQAELQTPRSTTSSTYIPSKRPYESEIEDRKDIYRRRPSLPPTSDPARSINSSPPPPPPTAYGPTDSHPAHPARLSALQTNRDWHDAEPIPPPPAKYSYPLPSISEALGRFEDNTRGVQADSTSRHGSSHSIQDRPVPSPPKYHELNSRQQIDHPHFTPQSTHASLAHPPHIGHNLPPSSSFPPLDSRRESAEKAPQTHPSVHVNQEEWRSGYAPTRDTHSYTALHGQPYIPSLPHQDSAVSGLPGKAPFSPSHPEPATQNGVYARTWQSISSEEDAKKAVRPVYGEAVKRQLDLFDFEQSLHGIATAARDLIAFSDYYRQRAHETHRTGPQPNSIPHLQEIDDMMKNGTRIQESLNRLRDAVVTQQAELAEITRKHSISSTQKEGPARDERKTSVSFPTAESKKRRGRAAPPGKCHSCNRIDTPEWRRGPDGARTLCNACGLHYAKLTRKAGTNKAAHSSSNLRPKDENT